MTFKLGDGIMNIPMCASVKTKLWRIIAIPDSHYTIQDDGQVSCRYQFHMNPYLVKCTFTKFDPPFVVNIYWNMTD